MKQQKIIRGTQAKRAVVIDERTKEIPPPSASFNPEIANQPVRTVNFVEVHDMEPQRVQFLVRELGIAHNSAKGGIHYFIPIRHGKITSDVIFEAEFLAIVEKMCEIKDGKIMLKDGAKDVTVIRQKI